MGLTKRTYTDNVTVITAQNLNDIQDAIIALEASSGDGLTEDIKQALLQIAQKVAYIDNQGATYYQDLCDALYPPATLVSINAVFTQGSTVVYDTASLDSLKSMLVVTGTYDDQSTETIPSTDYTLSGTLTAGTSTITVTCDGKTTTFTVQVTHQPGVYAVTNTLTGCTNSNAAASVTEGDSYSGTITASSGYTLMGATVSITMGGTDITSTAYSNGMISIASVTGALVISVTAVVVTLSSISAVYTQSGTVWDTDSLDSLKSDLVVTATYSDSSTTTVAAEDYTLSGTLAAATSTITVSYGGKTTTFNVTVTAAPLYAFPERTATETDYTLVTTKSGHLKLTVINPITWQGANGIAINVYGGKVAALNDPVIGIKNQPKTFTIAANSSCVFAISNIANPSAASLSLNLYKANAEASTGSTFSLSATTSDESKSVTPTDSLDIYTPFIYVNLGTLPSGFTLECDLSLTVGNERYF